MAEFLCLANSRREGGRCVAGLVPGRGWVRPVPDRSGSAVPLRGAWHFGLLDLVDVDLGSPVPIPGQRENVLLGPEGFSKVQAHDPARLREEMEALIEERPPLLELGGPTRIPFAEVQSGDIGQSLALVEPATVHWSVETDRRDQPRVRCQFDLGRRHFGLRVTDPEIEELLRDAALGTYHRSAAGIPDDHRLLLTISLGGAFEGYCYKLVAAAMPCPARRTASPRPSGSFAYSSRKGPSALRPRAEVSATTTALPRRSGSRWRSSSCELS